MKRALIPILLLVATSAAAADIDVVRGQFIAYSTAAGADRTSTRMADALGALQWSAQQHADALGADGSWPDIQYNETPAGGWGPWAHTQRLWVLAKAYQTPGQSLYRDPRLLADINAALAHTKTFYGASILPTGNWWFWTIGIPIDLGPTLVLMQGHADRQVVDELTTAIHVRILNAPTQRGLIGPTPTGQNLVWSSYTHLCLALLKNDEARLNAVRDAMASVARPATGDGIKRDASFHQHGAQLYTGGYGGQFASDVARYALITRGTSFQMPSDALTSFADYIADGVAWAMYGDYFDVSVIGREVARPTTTGFNGMAALVQAAQFASPRAAEIRSAASKILQTWGGMPIELAGAAALVESAGYNPAWPSGHRHYYASDYSVHRRSGWFASIKMFSTRTKSGEKTNEENLLGSRQSDGRFSLVLRGDEYFGRNVWPALDWTRLPGTTVEQKADTANDTYGYGTRTLAGGTGDGRNGVSAMDLAPLNSALTAKKSWFFFDDAIVFLTNSIRSTSANRIETIVNQVSTSSSLTQRPDWMHLDNVGYWFPSGTAPQTARATRSGTWAGLGGSSDTTVHTKPYTTLYFDHGAAPVNATAEYVIVPGITSAAMGTWTATRPISILANNDIVSAARDNRNGNIGIAFWRPASIDGIQSSAPAVVYITQDRTTMQLWAADPNGTSTGSFTLTVPGLWTVSGAQSSRTSRATTITIPRASGATTHVRLTRHVKRRAT
jgi:chondroitin AC lyase